MDAPIHSCGTSVVGTVDRVTTVGRCGADNAWVGFRNLLYVALLMAAAWQAWGQWRLRDMHPPDGQIAPLEPMQNNLDEAVNLQHGRWRLVERASYDITARILHREDYRFDPLSDLIPEDLALGWGPMSDNRVLAHFEISQGGRFYSWQSLGALSVPRQVAVTHSANTHVIPGDTEVRRELAALRAGEVVHLIGSLVDGERDDGLRIRTSMTRNDEGAGACEVMLVDTVEVLPPEVSTQ